MILWRFVTFTVVLIICVSNELFCQTVRNFNLSNGLQSETIYSCLEDRYGYMWFSSSSGVSRFDGDNWTYFTSIDGLPDNDVLNMHEDSYVRIWFLSLTGELSYFFDGKIFNANDLSLFKYNKIDGGIISIFEDKNNDLWLNPIVDTYASFHMYEFNYYSFFDENNDSTNRQGFMFEINDEIYTLTHSMIYKLIDDKFVESSGFPLPLNTHLRHYDYLSKSVIYLSNDGVIKLNSDGDFMVLLPFEY